jgi:hypothetical protein
MNEIVHVDLDVVVHFENEIDLVAVLPHPVEHGDDFQRQIAVRIVHFDLDDVPVFLTLFFDSLLNRIVLSLTEIETESCHAQQIFFQDTFEVNQPRFSDVVSLFEIKH